MNRTRIKCFKYFVEFNWRLRRAEMSVDSVFSGRQFQFSIYYSRSGSVINRVNCRLIVKHGWKRRPFLPFRQPTRQTSKREEIVALWSSFVAMQKFKKKNNSSEMPFGIDKMVCAHERHMDEMTIIETKIIYTNGIYELQLSGRGTKPKCVFKFSNWSSKCGVRVADDRPHHHRCSCVCSLCVWQMRAPTANTLRRQSSMAEKSPNRRRRRRINEESDK